MGLSSEFLGRVDSLSDELVELLRGMMLTASTALRIWSGLFVL